MSTINIKHVNLYFHGTSYENYLNIMKYGFSSDKPLVWDCADKEMTYLYEFVKMIRAEGYDEEADFQEQFDFCLHRANENAQVTAAIQGSKSDKTVVFEIKVLPNAVKEFNKIISPDESCPNMADIGAMNIPSDELTRLWREWKIKVTPHFFRFYPSLGLFYIGNLYDSKYLEEAKWDMNETTRKAWEIVSKVDTCEVWDEITYTEEVEEDE